MKQQTKLIREKLKDKKLNGDYSETALNQEKVVLKVEDNGYIEYSVNYAKSLSEKDDNSWGEACSESDGGQFDDYYDEEVHPNAFLNDDGPEVIYNIYGEVIGGPDPL